MNSTSENPYSSHEQIALLLPWFVNKSLSDAERHCVEQHLKVCLLCNREVSNLQHLASVIKQTAPVDNAANASFQELKKRLHSTAAPQSLATQVKTTSTAKAKWYNNYSQNLIALAAATAFALVLPHFVPSTTAPATNDYRTLSNDEPVPSQKEVIKVIFKEQTAPATIQQLLSSIQGNIMHGPDEQALYIIGFNASTSEAELQEKLTRLRNDQSVVFAEPSYTLLSVTPARP